MHPLQGAMAPFNLVVEACRNSDLLSALLKQPDLAVLTWSLALLTSLFSLWTIGVSSAILFFVSRRMSAFLPAVTRCSSN